MIEPDQSLDALVHQVIGVAIDVHRALGPGFQEGLYEEAMAYELSLRGIAFDRQVELPIHYKDRVVGRHRLDLLVEDQLVLELKAVDHLADIHTAQILSYLRATQRPLGLLINFNASLLKRGIKRVVLSPPLGDLGALAAHPST